MLLAQIFEVRKGIFWLNRREEGGKDIHKSTQNATLFVDLFSNIFLLTNVI